MQVNNNLSDREPNLEHMSDLLLHGRASEVYYVHFDHITNETSHYFIICKVAQEILVLQSAVFEFNIFEWLQPKANIDSCKRDFEQVKAELGTSDDIRDRYALEQHERTFARQLAILENIDACKYSSGRRIPIRTFIGEFIPKLQTIEGAWTLENMDEKCQMYRELFSCRLNYDIIRSHVKLGTKDASVKLC
jgi:hypothetical protein